VRKFFILIAAGYACVALFIGITIVTSKRRHPANPQEIQAGGETDAKGREDGFSQSASSGPVGSGSANQQELNAKNRNRTFKTFYKTGRLSSSWIFKDGLLTGAAELYYEDGNPRLEMNFVKGAMEGPWREYDESGNLTEEMSYSRGIPAGVAREYYPGKKTRSEISYEEGEPRDPVFYSENGERVASALKAVEDAAQTETLIAFYADGTQSGVWQAKAGMLEGPGRWFDRKGRLQQEVPYKEGAAQGTAKAYSAEGVLLEEAQYVNGLRQGVARYYYPDGTLWLEMSYEHGILAGVPKGYSQAKTEPANA